MKSKQRIAIFVVIMLACSVYYSIEQKNAGEHRIQDQYIVIKMESNIKQMGIRSLTEGESKRLRQKANVLLVEKEGYVVGCSNLKNNSNLINKISHEKLVTHISSRNLDSEWNIQTINASEFVGNTMNKVKVAVIDSGIDENDDINVYMRKNFIYGEDEVPAIYEDNCGHGTGVAGIIAAKNNSIGITGINPNVELYSAKVLDKNCSAPISRVIEAIYWAIGNHVNIMNLSFGTTTDSAALRMAIQDAYNAGILIVAAAGNNGAIEYPAAYDEVISVGAVNSLGNRCECSATGPELELVAPGEQILTTGAFNGVMISSGTSMAAPHVSGIASILWEKDLTCSNDFIRKLMDYSANLYGDKNEYGYGLIDLKYALNHYDEFKKRYLNHKLSKDRLEEENKDLLYNNSEVVTFDDIDYVVGSWSLANHSDQTGSHSDMNNLYVSDLSFVKQGALESDLYLSGMYPWPEFHGYFAKKTHAGSEYVNLCNYMASYMYLTQLAKSIGDTGTIATVPSYMSTEDALAITSVITVEGLYTDSGFKTWDTILGAGNATNSNKRYYIYGMALHAAADIFAHSTFRSRNESSNIYHVHGNATGADSPSDISNRYTCAKAMASIVANHIRNNEVGSISDFAAIAKLHYNTDSGVYYLKNYSKYAEAVDPEAYYSSKEQFDAMSY